VPSLVSDEGWRASAECGRRDIYHPDTWQESKAFAKEVCRTRCPVREQCLEWALAETTRIDGIAGGLTEGERRTIKRKRKKGIAA
jgi:WhiB family redox-sensing transcriptional regulator